MQLHVAQGGKAVEPGVGHGLAGVGKVFAPHAGDELLALRGHFGGPGLASDQGNVALGLGGGHFKLACLVRQTQQVGTGRDSGDEVLTRLGGVGL